MQKIKPHWFVHCKNTTMKMTEPTAKQKEKSYLIY